MEPLLENITSNVKGGVVESCLHPWMAIVNYTQGDTEHICGGILVHKKYVLTAAQCAMAEPAVYEVYLGKHDRFDNSDGVLYAVSTITVRFLDVSDSLFSDYAVLKLANAADTNNPRILPIDLGKRTIWNGEMCQIIGWGTQAGDNLQYPQIANVAILNNTQCAQDLEDDITDNMICAVNQIPAVCPGDIGGPLICQTDGKWEVHGITSLADSACAQDVPDVYTRISANFDALNRMIPGSENGNHGFGNGNGNGNS
uniref:Chymotrypsin A-like n=1 Tax=Saccoglossus kowalevskii TaxID=10224 RepID=A0ABM0MGE5_SACKO|nr:PREDICTED: chymotrypsin A-like [Saccoglossus kowalevskii]